MLQATKWLLPGHFEIRSWWKISIYCKLGTITITIYCKLGGGVFSFIVPIPEQHLKGNIDLVCLMKYLPYDLPDEMPDEILIKVLPQVNMEWCHLCPTARRGSLKYLFHTNITDSQIPENGWHLWRPTFLSPLLRAGSPMADCSKPCPLMFWISPQMQSQHSSLGNVIQCLITITEIKKCPS